MDKVPAAYIRRSFVDAQSPGDISRDLQRAAVRRLAAADGHDGNLVEYDDWGVSADIAKTAKRTAYTRLLGDMEAGSITAVYAFDVDRLYRDPRDLIRLQDAAYRHDVRIVTTGGPLPINDGDDPAGEAFAFIGAIFGRMELQKSKKRARAALAARRDRGDRLGRAPYGWRNGRRDGVVVLERDPGADLAPILSAYEEAGSVLGACRLLEARGIQAPKGGKRWATSMLTRTIEREWPDRLPRRTLAGRRTPVGATLAQLLRCPFCAKMLTPNMHRGQYYCSNGPRDRDLHPRYTVREVDVLPWIMAEAAFLRLPGNRVQLAEERTADRVRLAEERRRLALAFARQAIDEPTWAAEDDAIRVQLEALDAGERIVDLPQSVDWTKSPTIVNEILRALWQYVQLGPDLRPVSAEWLVPEWRA